MSHNPLGEVSVSKKEIPTPITSTLKALSESVTQFPLLVVEYALAVAVHHCD